MFYLICFVFCGLYGSNFNALDQRTSYLLVAYVHFEEGILEYLRHNKVCYTYILLIIINRIRLSVRTQASLSVLVAELNKLKLRIMNNNCEFLDSKIATALKELLFG